MNLNRENQKGFTLVELIVVIVIIGVLAAIAIPSFAGYVNKGDKAADELDARTAYLAAQTVVTEERIKNVDQITSVSEKLAALDGNTIYDDTLAAKKAYKIKNITNGQVTIEYKGTMGTITMNGDATITSPSTPPGAQ